MGKIFYSFFQNLFALKENTFEENAKYYSYNDRPTAVRLDRGKWSTLDANP
tara:strand:- start:893 stop:1045 length:153 start_codon:yes stop_codon:yes gene_type:complete